MEGGCPTIKQYEDHGAIEPLSIASQQARRTRGRCKGRGEGRGLCFEILFCQPSRYCWTKSKTWTNHQHMNNTFDHAVGGISTAAITCDVKAIDTRNHN